MIKSGKILGAIVFSFLLCGCIKQPASPAIVSNTPADTTIGSPTGGNNRAYIALGDSYTIGQSVDAAERYPAQTAALLAAQGTHFDTIKYIAATGWTTLDLQSAIELQNPQGPFAAVSLLIGVNDQYQTHDTSNYRERFTQLLETAIALSGNNRKHVFVLSVPDYGVTPFGANYPGAAMQIDQFNAINKGVTEQYGISYTNITGISRDDAGDATMLAYDGLHPSGRQYAQWAAALAPAMEKGLK